MCLLILQKRKDYYVLNLNTVKDALTLIISKQISKFMSLDKKKNYKCLVYNLSLYYKHFSTTLNSLDVNPREQ